MRQATWRHQCFPTGNICCYCCVPVAGLYEFWKQFNCSLALQKKRQKSIWENYYYYNQSGDKRRRRRILTSVLHVVYGNCRQMSLIYSLLIRTRRQTCIDANRRRISTQWFRGVTADHDSRIDLSCDLAKRIASFNQQLPFHKRGRQPQIIDLDFVQWDAALLHRS